MKLSEKILYLRKRAGLSQEDLANQLDVSRQAIYKWETEVSFPEIANIKGIAKIFNVTFNYLMNDEVEEIEEEKVRVNVEPRKVFTTDATLKQNQPDIDSGYHDTHQGWLKEEVSDSYYNSRRAAAEKAMRAVGATEIYYLQTYSATAFFYDENKMVCGVYFGGAIQFVCPIENLAGFDFNSGDNITYNTKKRMPMAGFNGKGINSVGMARVPSVGVEIDTLITSFIAYREGMIVKKFPLDFSVDCKCYFDKRTNDEEKMVLQNALKTAIITTLKELRVRISALMQVAQKITEGLVEPKEVDYNLYAVCNEKTNATYEEYLRTIENAAITDNRRSDIKQSIVGLFLGSLVIGAVILIGVALKHL